MSSIRRSANGRERVTFSLPAEVHANTAVVCGDFNDWSTTTGRMRHYKDGHFAVTLDLEPGQEYRYRFLLDGERWENDWSAAAYVPNPFGSDDSVIRL